jgi:hypothetical protein
MENRALFLWQCERRKSSLMNKNVANRQILIASAGKSRPLHLGAALLFLRTSRGGMGLLLFTRAVWEMGSKKRLAFRRICEFFARVVTINCSPAAGPHTGRGGRTSNDRRQDPRLGRYHRSAAIMCPFPRMRDISFAPPSTYQWRPPCRPA